MTTPRGTRSARAGNDSAPPDESRTGVRQANQPARSAKLRPDWPPTGECQETTESERRWMNATNATPHDAGQADPPRHAAHSKAIEIERAAATKICLEDTGMRSTPLLQAIVKSSTSTCAEPMVPELRDHWQMLGLIEAAFEGETAVAVHQDINDAAQTVLVEKAPVTTTTPTARTHPASWPTPAPI